jgi:hypothetical protein
MLTNAKLAVHGRSTAFFKTSVLYLSSGSHSLNQKRPTEMPAREGRKRKERGKHFFVFFPLAELADSVASRS